MQFALPLMQFALLFSDAISDDSVSDSLPVVVILCCHRFSHKRCLHVFVVREVGINALGKEP